jgi:hypothetical protein
MSKRFRTLENTFDLDSMATNVEIDVEDGVLDDDISDDVVDDSQLVSTTAMKSALELAEQIDKQLSAARSRDVHDDEMDELAGLAIQAHKDLQDLGMNVEIRHAGEIFSSSSQMLKIAVDAKNSKVDKKLKMLKLQLDKLKMDRAYKPTTGGNAVEGKATMLDRNELLKQLGEIEDGTK